MRKFTEMKFFQITEELLQSKTDLSFLEEAFEEFTDSVFAESESIFNLTAFYNQLCYAQIELLSRQNIESVNHKKEQTPIQNHYFKALLLIDTQLKLVGWKIKNNNNNQSGQEKTNRVKSKIKWTGTTYELVELGYAILATKSVNNGEVDIKELMQFLCSVFDFDIKNFYHAYSTIRHRAGDRTIYLDKLKEKLMDKMEEADIRKLKRC